jgi:SWI/SNF-related matrix-associated actin-dependent regulator 1 of chromatin subfamily A
MKPQSILPQAVTPSSEVEDAAFQEALRISEGLFAHQIEGVAFLLARRRCILADDMGLGKTRQSIVAMRHAAPEGPWLVVTPASVKLNWEREIRAVDANARTRVLQGEPDGPDRPVATGEEWVIINYDVLGRWIDALTRVEWQGLIFDEAHYLKNHTSARSRFARTLALEKGGDAVVHALTGTPLTNRPRDLFPLLQLVQHPLGKSFLSFAKRYCAATQNDYGWVTDGASHLEELTVQLHGIMIRRRKDDVLELPPKLRNWLPVEVPEDTGGTAIRAFMQSLVTATLQQRAGAPADGDTRDRRDRGKLLASLTKAREQLAAAKVKSSIELVDGILEQEAKVIVFSCFNRPVQALQKHFGEACVVLNGETPSAKRQALVDRFQTEPGIRVFVANLIAGGVGLNLTAASHVVFNDLDWVPANHWQGEDRAYRIGQTGTVNVHYLVAAQTLDEFVHRVLETKAALADAVVDGAALSPAATRDVMAELESMVARISPQLADREVPLTEEEWVQALIAEVQREAQAVDAAEIAGAPPDRSTQSALSRAAIEALARALTRPAAKIYKATSSSSPGKFYTLTYEGGETTCSCPGFEYRGNCSHSRVLKAALVKGSALPAGFSEG